MRGLTPVFVILSLVALGAALWWTRSEPEPAVAPVAAPVPPAAPVLALPSPTPLPSSPAPSVRELERPPAAPSLPPPSLSVPLDQRAPLPQGVVTARSLLDKNDPRGALQQLDSIDVWTPEAEVLRAEAHAQLGDSKALDASLKKLKASGFVREAKALKEKLAR